MYTGQNANHAMALQGGIVFAIARPLQSILSVEPAAQQNFDVLESCHFLQFSERSKRNIKRKAHEIMSQVSKLKKVKN